MWFVHRYRYTIKHTCHSVKVILYNTIMHHHPNEKSMHLHAFNLFPQIRYENQWKDEQILLVLRRSPFTQVGWVLITIFFLFVLLVLNLVYPAFLDGFQILFINIFGLALVFAYAWINFLIWFFNVGIVTNMRIIDIDFHGIVSKETTQAELDQITDVTGRTLGFSGSLFNYGDVHIKTDGFQQNIEFLRTPEPNRVVDIINRILRSNKQKKPNTQ